MTRSRQPRGLTPRLLQVHFRLCGVGTAHPSRWAHRSHAFTLLEVLAAMGLALLLMAALMQSMDAQARYCRTAEEKMTEPQIARILLHRIADELRAVRVPVDAWRDPTRARRLLSFADVTWKEGEGEMTASTASSTEQTMGLVIEEENPWRGAERFGLLGTSNRLLFLTHRPSEAPSAIEAYASENARPTVESGTGDNKREPDRWGDLRQVFYLPLPLPEALSARREGEPNAEIREPDSDEDGFEPYYGGVLRQEVLLPFDRDASRESFEQLVGHLMEKSEATTPAPQFQMPTEKQPESTAGEKPLPPRVVTEVLNDRVSAIRFRYHDGRSWLEAWSHHAVLPRAVEISLSFDPRASDPRWLGEYLEDQRRAADSGAMARPAATSSADGFEPPVFPYRLVVALPAADRTPMVTEESIEGQVQPLSEGEETLP